MNKFLLFPALLGLLVQCTPASWEKGVSAPFAGKMGGEVVIAGGCNFPGKPAAEGGAKVFYDGIYTLDGQQIGTLPEPMAYGAAASYGEALICAGGCNQEGPSDRVFALTFQAGEVLCRPLPSLPVPVDNTSGAICHDTFYLVGGNQNGVPSQQVFSLDLLTEGAQWVRETPFPGHPRIQPVAVAQAGKLFAFGGFAPKKDSLPASLSVSSLCFDVVAKTWTPRATPLNAEGEEVSLGGGCGVAVGDSLILCAGGVHKDLFLSALQGLMGSDYLTHEPAWYKFNDQLLLYDTALDGWTSLAQDKAYARAGASLVNGEDESVYLIHGEVKPGVRTPDVRKISVK